MAGLPHASIGWRSCGSWHLQHMCLTSAGRALEAASPSTWELPPKFMACVRALAATLLLPAAHTITGAAGEGLWLLLARHQAAAGAGQPLSQATCAHHSERLTPTVCERKGEGACHGVDVA